MGPNLSPLPSLSPGGQSGVNGPEAEAQLQAGEVGAAAVCGKDVCVGESPMSPTTTEALTSRINPEVFKSILANAQPRRQYRSSCMLPANESPCRCMAVSEKRTRNLTIR